MPRKVTPAQYNAMVRRAQQKHRQDVQKYNQQVRKVNSEIKRENQKRKTAIDKYNREARAHNARVRSDRNRLRSEIAKLNSRPPVQHRTTIRTSVNLVTTSYDQLERRYPEDNPNDRVNEFLDLSEREAANAAGILNALEADDQEHDPNSFDDDGGVVAAFLDSISTDIASRWRGAIFSLNPKNPDAARHFCTSAREVFTQVIEVHASDNAVLSHDPHCDLHNGKPNRRAKLGFLFSRAGVDESAIADFAEVSVGDVQNLFQDLNSGTHGSAGKYNLNQLLSLRKRAEDTLDFLRHVIS